MDGWRKRKKKNYKVETTFSAKDFLLFQGYIFTSFLVLKLFFLLLNSGESW